MDSNNLILPIYYYKIVLSVKSLAPMGDFLDFEKPLQVARILPDKTRRASGPLSLRILSRREVRIIAKKTLYKINRIW